MLVVSIDVGIVALGISLCEVTLEPDFVINRVIHCNTINLVQNCHQTCRKNKCKSFGEKTHSHYVKHFIKSFHQKYFERSKYILIERQPKGGYTSIEQLLNFFYEERCILQSPMTLHSWLGTIGAERVVKKAKTEAIALPYIQKNKGFLKQQQRQHKGDNVFLPSTHDICDTIAYVLLWLKTIKEEHERSIPLSNPFRGFCLK
jgi:hypothetical protein